MIPSERQSVLHPTRAEGISGPNPGHPGPAVVSQLERMPDIVNPWEQFLLWPVHLRDSVQSWNTSVISPRSPWSYALVSAFLFSNTFEPKREGKKKKRNRLDSNFNKLETGNCPCKMCKDIVGPRSTGQEQIQPIAPCACKVQNETLAEKRQKITDGFMQYLQRRYRGTFQT